jgi:hypothetical protein
MGIDVLAARRELSLRRAAERANARRIRRESLEQRAAAAGMSVQMYRYYSNHVNAKARSAASAAKRYARIKDTPEFKIMSAARHCVTRIAQKIKTHRRKVRNRTFELLGCDYDTAAAWIAAQFRDGMTWENHGEVWEIDHKRPLASFDLKVEDQRRQAMHYTNLQPLLVHENRAKSDKWESAA